MAHLETPNSRNKLLQVRLSALEYKTLNDNAKKSGFSSNAEYIRYLLEKRIVRR